MTRTPRVRQAVGAKVIYVPSDQNVDAPADAGRSVRPLARVRGQVVGDDVSIGTGIQTCRRESLADSHGDRAVGFRGAQMARTHHSAPRCRSRDAQADRPGDALLHDRAARPRLGLRRAHRRGPRRASPWSPRHRTGAGADRIVAGYALQLIPAVLALIALTTARAGFLVPSKPGGANQRDRAQLRAGVLPVPRRWRFSV